MSRCPCGQGDYDEATNSCTLDERVRLFPKLFDRTRTPLYRLPAAASIAGISYRQADSWIRDGVVEITQEAEGSGSNRLISAAQVVRLCSIQQLRAQGIELRVAVDPPAAIAELVDDVEIVHRLRELAELTPGGWVIHGRVVLGAQP